MNQWPYKPATPVAAEPLPEYVRVAIHDLVRRGAKIIHVAEDPLGDPGDFRIVYEGNADLSIQYVYSDLEKVTVAW